MRPRIVVTLGDPRGIGPEVALRALDVLERDATCASIVLVGPDGPMEAEDLSAIVADARADPGSDEAAGLLAGRSIERAVELAMRGEAHAVVTSPIHKPSLHAAGWKVPGQTEMLRDLAGASRVGMLMTAERTRLDAPLRVLLATTHIPLRAVPDALAEDLIVEQVELLDEALRADWGFEAPTIAVCGLNPHASDQGLFGSEEADVFRPALIRARASGVDVQGPLPADTVFSRALAGEFDAVVSPYHDVGMAAFKTVSFGTGVNVSIGLPFVRTSPDHGTAFDIAGTDRAKPDSMVEAIRLAHALAKRRFDIDSSVV